MPRSAPQNPDRVAVLAAYYQLEIATLKRAGLSQHSNAAAADKVIEEAELCKKNVKGNTKNAKQNIMDTFLSI